MTGLLVGLAVMTASLAYLLFSDAGRRMELAAFDWRIRHCNSLRPSTPIVHLDIDDNSLERVGRWPWHRDRLADVVRVLKELGAANILIDLLLSEPEASYVDDPRFDPQSGLEAAQTIGELSELNYVHPDLELAEAFRSAGNIILATQFDIQEPDGVNQRLQSLLASRKDLTPAEAIRLLSLDDTPARRAEMENELLRLRLRRLLVEEYTLSDQQLAERSSAPLSAVTAVVAGVKTATARQLVGKMFAAGATPSREKVFDAILKDRKDTLNADRTDLAAAYFMQVSLAQVQRSSYAADAELRDAARRASDAVPPQHDLARAAQAVAAVNFEADVDGGVRRVPLLLLHEGRIVPHMGLAAACRILGLDASRMKLRDGRTLEIPALDGASSRAIPIDSQGDMVLHWTATAKDWRTGADFPHISAAKVYALADARRQIRQNQTAINYKLAEVVAAAKGEYTVTSGPAAEGRTRIAADSAYRRKVNEQLAFERKIHLSRLRGDVGDAELAKMHQESARQLAEIQLDQRQAAAAVALTCREIDQVSAEELAKNPAAGADAKRFRAAQAILKNEIPPLEAANKLQARTVSTLAEELGGLIKDKYVFVGFAATAEGDIVSTPIDSRTNGVMCHAHALNGILQNRFIAPADRRLAVIACLLLGAAVSVVTATRSPRLALLSTLGLMAAYAWFNAYLLFMRAGVWFVLAPPLVMMFVTWAFVTLYRQLTAERERRAFAKQLGQYTSPIIAARIAESPEAVAAFKTVQTRDMTCLFSDLAGFTTISEQENPEVVQHVLNTYLERMSHVIWSNRGLINKFMGDGIMAFFNPSVDPLEEHPLAACETAVRTLEELERLKQERAGDPAARIFQQLVMRMGLAAGLVKNGDLGSELKADYTVIGDVVNLAARLEPAKKGFGTLIMVSGPLHDRVKERFEFRYLAELQVKGKAETVPVYEIISRKGALTAEQREYVERFEAGVRLYQARKWDECIVHFTRLLSRRFDDLGASRYIDACQEFKRFPPEDNWRGALELKEK